MMSASGLRSLPSVIRSADAGAADAASARRTVMTIREAMTLVCPARGQVFALAVEAQGLRDPAELRDQDVGDAQEALAVERAEVRGGEPHRHPQRGLGGHGNRDGGDGAP